MLRVLILLILMPIIILAAITVLCALIEVGFQMLGKILIILAAICVVRWVFGICGRAS